MNILKRLCKASSPEETKKKGGGGHIDNNNYLVPEIRYFVWICSIFHQWPMLDSFCTAVILGHSKDTHNVDNSPLGFGKQG